MMYLSDIRMNSGLDYSILEMPSTRRPVCRILYQTLVMSNGDEQGPRYQPLLGVWIRTQLLQPSRPRCCSQPGTPSAMWCGPPYPGSDDVHPSCFHAWRTHSHTWFAHSKSAWSPILALENTCYDIGFCIDVSVFMATSY